MQSKSSSIIRLTLLAHIYIKRRRKTQLVYLTTIISHWEHGRYQTFIQHKKSLDV